MRKRSKYRPKGIQRDPIGWVLNGMVPVRAMPVVTTLRIKNHGSIESLRTGKATKNDIDSIVAAFNMAEALVRIDIGTDYANEVREGQLALLALSRKGVERGMRFIGTAQELQAVNMTMEVHDAQLDICTVVDIERALKIVETELRLKRAHLIMEKKHG